MKSNIKIHALHNVCVCVCVFFPSPTLAARERSEQNLSLSTRSSSVFIFKVLIVHVVNIFNPLNPELNPIC
jgi:hypothetical protein